MPRQRTEASNEAAIDEVPLSKTACISSGPAGYPFDPGQCHGESVRAREKVPPLPQNLTWLNTAGPLELHDLRGEYVLLDFWTYCCINCMHILPELHKLEQAWPKNLVVIGVHSAKFTTEQDTQDIRAAIQRYKIEHPVINDARHELWESFGVRAWPTVILIDLEGYAVWGTSGEITFEQVNKASCV